MNDPNQVIMQIIDNAFVVLEEGGVLDIETKSQQEDIPELVK